MTVYILKCSDNSYYTGVTNNLERRMYEHNTALDLKCYTASRRPIKLLYSADFETPMDAISIEKKIKHWSRKKKEALINGEFEKLHELSKCRNDSSFEKRTP